MSDYISREDVLKGKKTGTFANGICLVAEPCVTVEYIESLEPANVVPVVRCKDCRKCTYDSLFDSWWCSPTLGARRVKPDDFCSYGKREE